MEHKDTEYLVSKAELNAAKGDMLKLCEMTCPTDRSFDRIKKETHDIFDRLMKKENV